MASIGVAISGGGHRAALFGLGALMYMADAGKNPEVTSIASVSGGSLTNGFVAKDIDFTTTDGAQFQIDTAPFAEQLAQRGTVFAWRGTWLYLAALALSLVAVIALWWLPLAWPVRLGAFLVALFLWTVALRQRGRVCGRAFAATVFRTPGSPTKLTGIHKSVDHVFCATDLHAGEHVYFSGSFVCAYQFGWGTPADLALHTAVQASAALPGAFPVAWLPTRRHGFVGGQRDADRMALTDGGVYDNMADQWPAGVKARKDRWQDLAADLHEPEELVVVNASASLSWGSLTRFRTPIVGDLLALLRCKDVLYDNTTSLRRSGLVGRFDRAALQGSGLRGGLVHIPQSPFDVAKAFDGSTAWPERAKRAANVLAGLAGESEEAWKQVALDNSSVKTTLSGLGGAPSARLIRHAYVLAMCNLHVILGYPLFDVPSEQRFLDLVR